jgi:rhodanese-related sulfurtransferase
MKLLTAFLLTFSILWSSDLYEDIDVLEAVELQEEGAVFIDVRTPSEFIHTGHGLGHVNIPIFYEIYTPKALKTRKRFSQMENENKKGYNSRKLYESKVIENDKFVKEVFDLVSGDLETEIVLICHSGNRSGFSAEILAKKGFENVYNLEGGFLQWRKNKKPFSVD